MHLGLLSGLVAVMVVLAAAATAHPSQVPPAIAGGFYLTPLTDSDECTHDSTLQSACRLIRRFFRAVNSRRFGAACAMLGKALRSDSMGITCPAFLDAAVPMPVPWGIVGARPARTKVIVFVIVGQRELEKTRMWRHRALVGLEDGRWRILQTRRVS